MVAPQFPLTSTRPEPYDQVTDYVNQPADISFVLDRVLASPLAAKIDPNRIGAAGLSLGGGTIYGLVYNPCCIDKRIKSAEIFDSMRFPFATPFGKNAIPVLIMHIDKDLALPYAKAAAVVPRQRVAEVLHDVLRRDPSRALRRLAVAARRDRRKVTIDFWDLTLLGDTASDAIASCTTATSPGSRRRSRLAIRCGAAPITAPAPSRIGSLACTDPVLRDSAG